MPQLRVVKNGQPFCVVGSDDVWMFSASLWTDLWGPEASMLDVSGGSMPRADGSHDFLIWAMPDELVRGDSIDIYFEPGTQSNPKGAIFKFDRGAELESSRQFQSWPPLGNRVVGVGSTTSRQQLYFLELHAKWGVPDMRFSR